MRIGIDSRSVIGKKAGFGQYTDNLLSQLSKIDKENHYTLFFSKNSEIKYPSFDNKVIRLFRFPELWEQLRLPIEAAAEKIDLLHCPTNPGPIFAPCKRVFTLHDVNYMRYPEFSYDKKTQWYWSLFSRAAAKAADLIITISSFSKKEIIELFNVPEEKVEVIYLAAGDNFRQIKLGKESEKIDSLRKKYCLPGEFILFVGTVSPRKNLVTLLRAIAKLKKKGIKEKLVIVGDSGWKTKELSIIINELNLNKEIIFAGYVSEEELLLFYNLASVFVFPSIYEGFGLPVLEAMKSGCPVVASNNSCLPEIAGKAGLLVDPLDSTAFAEAIEKVLTDSLLRKRMILLGKKRASEFSWKKTAEQTIKAYKRAAQK
jgi:glycosyltransferase involved in cell wall biosynthesis